MEIIRGVLKLLRPKHWVKNLFVFAPIVFAAKFDDWNTVLIAIQTFVAFCFVASATYALNDLFDVEADRAHPTKKTSRPIASGEVSVSSAWLVFSILMALTVVSLLSIKSAAAVVGGYFLLQLAYNFRLKRQPVLDIFTIAVGFVLRVFAGALAVGVPVSKWMFVTTFSLALFLASMKRFQELKTHGDKARKVLEMYSVTFVQRIAEISGTLAVVFYSFFSLTTRPALIFTIPVVVFALVRYWFVADRGGAGESPTDLVLSDPQLISAFLLLSGMFWVALSTMAKP